jgi:S-adenosyl-L-methionine hydrolase (adenosine-forming)
MVKPVALLTDFGTKRGSHYVAAMKSVIHSISPKSEILDINHDLTPYSIAEATFMISYALHTMTEPTVIVVVVDPGVGTARDIVAIAFDNGHVVIGPNNGIFSLPVTIYQKNISEIYTVENPKLYYYEPEETHRFISDTFHGRNVMSAVGAHIAKGIKNGEIGPLIRLEDILINQAFAAPNIQHQGGNYQKIVCSALWVDTFGNVITNLPVNALKKITSVNYKEHELKIYNKFEDIEEDRVGLVRGSSGFLEICKKQDSAGKFLQIHPGHQIVLRP